MKFFSWCVGCVFGILSLSSCTDAADEPVSDNTLGSGELRFEIMLLDSSAFTAEAKVLAAGKTVRSRLSGSTPNISLILSRGDASYLRVGDVCRGRLGGLNDNAYRVDNLWPDSTGLRKRLEEANANLRREVGDGGGNLACAVGSELPEFAVIDQDGQVIDASFFQGKTTVINFFFTRCSNPSMCPATTRRLQQLLEQGRAMGLADLQVLSLSFDPERDAPGVLKDYAEAYQLDETSFRLATGPKQAMDDLRQKIGIKTRPDPRLIIDHTFRAVVVDGNRRLVAEIVGSSWSLENTLAGLAELYLEKGN